MNSISVTTRIGAIRNCSKPEKKSPTNGLITKNKKKKSRCVVWSNKQKAYRCIRKGIDFTSQDALLTQVAERTLTEPFMYIFQHTDKYMERNATIPKYEALWYCAAEQCYFRSQKAHLQLAYTNSSRTDAKKMWDTDPTTTEQVPYWVDRYAFSVEAQIHSKEKHALANKRKR